MNSTLFSYWQGHISCQIAHVLGVIRLLAMTKPSSGVCFIAMGEMLCQHTLELFFRPSISWCFWNTFVLHQFGIVTKGGCETLIRDIRCTLDLHLDLILFQLNMVIVFNLVSRKVIFQEFHATCGDIIKIIIFNCAFYAFEFLLFYNHHSREGDVIIIPFAMGTCQGDPLKMALFILVHFSAPCSIINCFLFHPLKMTFTS